MIWIATKKEEIDKSVNLVNEELYQTKEQVRGLFCVTLCVARYSNDLCAFQF